LRVLLSILSSPLARWKELEEISSSLKLLVDGLYDHEVSASSIDELRGAAEGFDAVLALALTGGVEEMLIELSRDGKPLMVIAHERMNSFPASLEAISELRKRGLPAWIIEAWLPDARKRAELILNGVKAALNIPGIRIGLIGEPSPWLIYSRSSRDDLKRRLQAELIELDLEELYSELEKVKAPDQGLIKRIMEKASSPEVREEEVADSIKVYHALRKLVERYGLNAFTIRCFDLIRDIRSTACLALSLMNDEGIVAGCEGDLPALMAMIIGSMISGSPTFLGNLTWIRRNEVALAHCTAPLTLLEEFSLRTHFETNMSVGVSGRIGEGQDVTLLRMSSSLDKLRAIGGRVIERASISFGCRTQVRVRVRREAAEKILEDPIGNHHVLALGDLIDGLKAFCDLKGIELEAYRL